MSQSLEKLQTTPLEVTPKVSPISREALARKLNIPESELPDRKFFHFVDEQLDVLAGLDPAKKAEALKKELARIDAAELADRAAEKTAEL